MIALAISIVALAVSLWSLWRALRVRNRRMRGRRVPRYAVGSWNPPVDTGGGYSAHRGQVDDGPSYSAGGGLFGGGGASGGWDSPSDCSSSSDSGSSGGDCGGGSSD